MWGCGVWEGGGRFVVLLERRERRKKKRLFRKVLEKGPQEKEKR